MARMSAPPDAPKPPPNKWRFILLQGVLGWGIPFFVLMLLWDRWSLGHWPGGTQIASLGCLSLFGGFILGRWMWRERDKQ